MYYGVKLLLTSVGQRSLMVIKGEIIKSTYFSLGLCLMSIALGDSDQYMEGRKNTPY